MLSEIQPQKDSRIDGAFVALASIIAGLTSLYLYPLSGILALGGLTLGCYVFVESKGNPSLYSAGSAKWIITGSAISLFLFVAIAASSLLTTHSALNEASAMTSLRSISSAQREFVKIGSGRYADLSELAKMDLIDSDLASGTRMGYRFYVRVSTSGFEAFAVPISYGSVFGTGVKSFYLTERGNLHRADRNGGEASSQDELVTEMKGIDKNDGKVSDS